MPTPKAKWLIYTVLVGSIPLLARFLIFVTEPSANIGFLFSTSEFVSLGLMLHITNVNELEHAKRIEKHLKTLHNGISLIFIVLFSVLLTIAFRAELPGSTTNRNVSAVCAIVLVGVSLVLSYSVHKLTTTSRS